MIRIKNWSSYQSYKDRRPPWIRLHKSLLDDYDFQNMSADARAMLPMLWLLASEHEKPELGIINQSYEKISFRLRLKIALVESAIEEILKAGFIQIEDKKQQVTDLLRNGYESVHTETETEANTEAESEAEEKVVGSSKNDLQNAVILYNEVAEKFLLPRCQNLTEARKKHLRLRLKEAGGIAGWKIACEMLARSPFLRGENERGWKASFDFMLQAKSFTKIMEGAYERNTNPKAGKPDYDARLRNAAAMDFQKTDLQR